MFADREAQDSALFLSWKVPSRPTATPAQYLEVMKVRGGCCICSCCWQAIQQGSGTVTDMRSMLVQKAAARLHVLA